MDYSMKAPLNAQGQPDRRLNAWRRTDRSVHELIGLARGLVADKTLCANEASALIAWLDANPDAATVFPGSILADRLERICDDGRVDADELRNLRIILDQMAGGLIENGLLLSATLPFNDPPPLLQYDSRVFVLTGHFAYGPRRICEAAITQQGGRCASDVSMQTHYLVVGTFSSRDWAQSSYGRKIEKAVKLRAAGQPIGIVSEDHWAESLIDVTMPHSHPDGLSELEKLLRRTVHDDLVDADELAEVLELLFSTPQVFDEAPSVKQLLIEMTADGRCTEAERLAFEEHVRALFKTSL
jgi:hypothetical protein